MVIVVDVPRSFTWIMHHLPWNSNLTESYFGKAVPDAFPFDALNNLRQRVYSTHPTVACPECSSQKPLRGGDLDSHYSCTFKFLQTRRLCHVIWWCSLGDIARFWPSTCTKSRRSLPEFVKINCSHLVPVPDSTLEWPEVLYISNARVVTFIHRTNILRKAFDLTPLFLLTTWWRLIVVAISTAHGVLVLLVVVETFGFVCALNDQNLNRLDDC